MRSKILVQLLLWNGLFLMFLFAATNVDARGFGGGVAIAPLLWRLDRYGIKLGKPAAPLMKYAERIFSRPAFIEALTPSEKVMRK